MIRHEFPVGIVRCTDYDSSEGTLIVTMRSGARLKYCGVPELVHRSLIRAASPDDYYMQVIHAQWGESSCERVDD